MKTLHTINELYLNGIYRIYCISNNKSYIGLASSFKNKNKKRNGFYARYVAHSKKLQNNKHHNIYLQYAYNKYGKDNFIFEILEICNPEECQNLEVDYMNLYNSMIHENGFNIIKQPLSAFNSIVSQEAKDKLSKRFLGIKRPLSDVIKWSTKVRQYTLEGEFVNEYYSMAEASRITGIQRQDIGQSIIGRKCKTAGGFIWKKDEDIV